ncbi:hypothetical protein [Helicobacter valdiviensis]|uniref:hypothetical protein n=1 Tax=Helicobacter valdiviensis TaxID=1458358 RepID=UPI0015EB35A9|nr:hypothetical protein [Helicobacter valdiviensis]
MDLNEKSNIFLIFGSGVLAVFFQIIAYLGISSAQVYALLVAFAFSGFAGFVKTISFREDLKAFICFDVTSKTLSLFIPFIVAFGAKTIPSLYIFVDYCFSFLILGEILSFLICIQALRTRNKEIKELDIYNLAINKFKDFVSRHLKLESKQIEANKAQDTSIKKEENGA